MDDVNVTIVVVPRERFSYTERSLRNIYEHTAFPFELVYVSGGAPSHVQRYLEQEAQRRNFRLTSVGHYLTPNEARNVGLREVKTRYVVFMDNDALVTPGWLDALVRCADETRAEVVGPLYLEGEIEDVKRLDRARIHMAGGKAHIGHEGGKRILYDEHVLAGMPLANHRVEIAEGPRDYVEFHTLLARTDVFERVGGLDEGLLSVNEHIDFCFDVQQAGGCVYMQPQAVTSYVAPPTACEWRDVPYFMLRWSEQWNVASARHFNHKHGVAGVRFFGDRSSLDEDTIVKFGRAQRRLMTGMRILSDGCDGPDSPAQEAELMLALLHSVDRDTCDLTVADSQGVLEQECAIQPRALMQRLPRLLQEAGSMGHSVSVRPRRHGHPNEPVVLCIDDVDSDGLARLQPHAFLTLETGPRRYQCWLAVVVGIARGATATRLLSSPPEGAGRTGIGGLLAGSKSRAQGNDFRVRLTSGQMGLVSPLAQLEAKGLTPYMWKAQRF
jgi:GT2 family glycosyltransferase